MTSFWTSKLLNEKLLGGPGLQGQLDLVVPTNNFKTTH